MVVAMLGDGSVTLKRLRQDAGRVYLVPENPSFQPIEAGDAKILGRVVGVLRKY
jgi:repressor LexA